MQKDWRRWDLYWKSKGRVAGVRGGEGGDIELERKGGRFGWRRQMYFQEC